MSNDSEHTASEPLSDEQRLQHLEKGGRLDRILIFALAAVLAMTLASWMTAGLLGLFSEAPPVVSSSDIEAVQQQLVQQEQQIAALQRQLEQLQQLAATPPSAPSQSPANDGTRESLQRLTNLLIDQEQSLQNSLAALKNGMRDLAGMIAGSRSWLDDYNEALDKPLSESQARVATLQQLLDAKPASPSAKP